MGIGKRCGIQMCQRFHTRQNYWEPLQTKIPVLIWKSHLSYRMKIWL
ncbi:hypothetical protein Golax_023441 [Gossypium laxum]|uniref:Uncharacterized protein n=1 Tax=Gossypium laxum TaxID=34288 RepID=A0A7J9AYN4_9ROSI|nr:hypothetical protein [Gossypium laxum]